MQRINSECLINFALLYIYTHIFYIHIHIALFTTHKNFVQIKLPIRTMDNIRNDNPSGYVFTFTRVVLSQTFATLRCHKLLSKTILKVSRTKLEIFVVIFKEFCYYFYISPMVRLKQTQLITSNQAHLTDHSSFKNSLGTLNSQIKLPF